MELREFLKIATRNIWAIIIFSVIGAVLAASIATKTSATVHLEQLFFIPAKSPNPESQIGTGYYDQETARNFTDTAVAILESPDFAKELKGQGTISVRKVAPQIIRISANAPHLQTAKGQIDEAASTFNRKMVDLSGTTLYELKAVGTGPQRTFSSPSKKVAAIFGVLAGSVFAIFAIGLKNYFKL